MLNWLKLTEAIQMQNGKLLHLQLVRSQFVECENSHPRPEVFVMHQNELKAKARMNFPVVQLSSTVDLCLPFRTIIVF